MARNRIELGQMLKDITGLKNVYFQPPSNIKMEYPCVVYSLSGINSVYADNQPFCLNKKYSVTAIYSDPDSDIPNKIASLPLCSFDRTYIADNLYHSVFSIY